MLTRKKISARLLVTWHRYMGLTVALLAIHLSLTGILLNHTSDLTLDKRYISNPVILDWYNIKLPEELPGFRINDNWVSQFEGKIYFNDRVVTETTQTLRGAITTPNFNIITTTEEIWLLTIDGEIIEKLSAPAEKLGDITSIGKLEDSVVIKTEQGIFQADQDLIAWQRVAEHHVVLSQSQVIPVELKDQLLTRDHSINWERLLLDLHSGRLATRAGTFLIDLAGIIMIVLAVTGFIVWLKRRRRPRLDK